MGLGRRPSVKNAVINFNSSGDNIVITNLASNPTTGPINVYGIIFTVGGATNITFKDGTTALSGAIVFTGNGSSMVLQINDEPYFPVSPGNNFVMNSSNAVQVSGIVYYTN